MKNKTLSTIQSIVFVLLFSCLISVTAHAQSSGGGGGGGANVPVTGDAWLQSQKLNICNGISSQISDNYSKFSAYCAGSSNAADCKSKIQDCLSDNSDEDLDSSDDSPDNSSQCYAMGYQSYKSDLKDMRQQERDSRKSLQDLQKQQTDAQKDYADQKSKLSKDAQEAADDYNKQAMQDKDDQRKQQQDQKSQQDSLNKQIRDSQMRILQLQNQQAVLTGARSVKIQDYSTQLIQCKLDAQKYQQQVKNNTLGGLAALSVKGMGNTSDTNTVWQSCVNKVLKQRDADATTYNAQMSELSAQITQTQQTLNDSQQSMQLMQTQAQQQNSDNLTKSQQQLQSYAAKQKNIQQQLQDTTQNFMQQSTQLGQAIQEAKQDNTIDSNSLKKFQGQLPPKTDTKAVDAYQALNQAIAACGSWTSNTCGTAPSTCNSLSGRTKGSSSKDTNGTH